MKTCRSTDHVKIKLPCTFQVDEEREVRQLLGFSSTFCQEDRLISTEPEGYAHSRRQKKSVLRCTPQHQTDDKRWYATLTDTLQRHRGCGAVLVDREWAATSSRCVQRYRNTPARLELTSLKKQKRRISRINLITFHPTWNQSNGRDLALVRLLKPLQSWSESKPICLANNVVVNATTEEVYHNAVSNTASTRLFDRQCSPWGISISKTTDGKSFLSQIFSRLLDCGRKVSIDVLNVKEWIEKIIYNAEQELAYQ